LCLTEAAEFFFVAPDGGGDGVQCGAEVGDFGGETRQGVCFPAVGAVFLDDGVGCPAFSGLLILRSFMRREFRYSVRTSCGVR
jgi:hypothetical protein